MWSISYRAEPAARALADRHYNRQSVGAAQFVPPGKCIGFRRVGMTKGGLVVLQLLPQDMPSASAAIGSQQRIEQER